MSNNTADVVVPDLRRIRTWLRLTATELAKISDVSRSSINKAEKGQQIGEVTARKILDSMYKFAIAQEISKNSENMRRLDEIIKSIDKEYLKENSNMPEIIKEIIYKVDYLFYSGILTSMDRLKIQEFRNYLDEKCDSLDQYLKNMNKNK
ncbi:MAG: helix-turn-helix domain-containing protein [Hyphomicrobiales bacterium]|nr:helix-turn-helix domain-containing protein [Hyphomicrobiales bacterium]MCP5371908.1 helix-turn-helix domain-containing protein [Hyphomicrobiales bacterium]